MLDRRHFLGAAASAAAGAQIAARPNFLFVLTDDQRWDQMSCASHPFARTPNMDRLAREGARFTNAFVTTPLCSPSRGCFQTGQYAHRHGILDNSERNAQSHTLPVYAKFLQHAGYETGYIGKWHMGHREDSVRPGFDYWVGFRGQGQYVDPQINKNGERGKVSGYITDILSDHAVDFIGKRRQKPFSLCLAHKAIHGPFTPAARHQTLFAGQKIVRGPGASDDLAGKPAMAGHRDRMRTPDPPRHGGPTDETILNMTRALMAVDEGLGKVLGALEETEQLGNTVIVFAGDNGYFFGEHQLGDKRRAYEEGLRIPLLVRYPKLVRAGSTPAAMAANIDLAPTLLDLAGVPVPRSMQGRSLVPLLTGKTRGWRQALPLEYFDDPPFPQSPAWQAIRSERWKLIRYPGHADWTELYDLENDPAELRNLVEDSRGRAILSKLGQQLSVFQKQASAEAGRAPASEKA